MNVRIDMQARQTLNRMNIENARKRMQILDYNKKNKAKTQEKKIQKMIVDLAAYAYLH